MGKIVVTQVHLLCLLLLGQSCLATVPGIVVGFACHAARFVPAQLLLEMRSVRKGGGGINQVFTNIDVTSVHA